MNARENFESLLSGLSNAETVAPSSIGGQFYCEKKVDLEREHGEVETLEKQRGTETHEKAAEDAVEVEMDEVWDAIERGERQILLETMFVGEAADFTIVGKPDSIVFDDGEPQLIFDRKTTSIPGNLFKNQRIQVWLYGYMLDSLEFDTDNLQIAILSHEQSLDPEVGKQLQDVIIQSYSGYSTGKTELSKEPEAYIYLFDYDPTDHLEDLDWALEYWRGDREAVPTKKAAKCRSCPLSTKCPDSLA
ncbi:PD-(D/E)XK nuclease family protein [Halomicroarcula sp. GCM10025324]|uniref:PD-(D/E)XK nuclease family protein n=1 Tax=Haloarcula TaxID=2237 RepID=UPI0023E8F313|nr:PD-(D/E)XK nuclease family protein [Halomicroarcula sp. ZS-22-S1]